MTGAAPPSTDGRPAVPSPTRTDWRAVGFTAAALAVTVAWVLGPIWGDLTTHILGDPDTDAVRGMWGFDHIRRSILPPDTPIWSNEVNFPAGVMALVLPWTSAIALSPLGFLLDPLVAYNLSVALMLVAAGLATAWLVQVNTQSWAAGGAMGAAMLSQPMLLHAMSDGTPEHFAIWAVPVFLALATMAFKQARPPLGVAAGVAAIAVALDSPYHAIYTAILAPLVMPWLLIRRWPRADRGPLALTIGAMLGTAAIGAVLVGLLYRQFPIEQTIGLQMEDLWRMNATDLHRWWQFDFGPRKLRDSSLAPALIPAPLLAGALALCIIGLPRALPWVLAATFMTLLSFGYNDQIPKELAQWWGVPGYQIGQQILAVNKQLFQLPGVGSIRFPQRWLVPAALSLLVGAGFGLGRVFAFIRRRRGHSRAIPVIAIAIGAAATWSNLDTSRMMLDYPKHEMPNVAFANWIASEGEPGAVIMLPQMRPAPKSGRRGDLPVFANIADSLSSSDEQYIQVRHGRPMISHPNLKTLVAPDLDTELYRLVRNWDDLAHPALTGNAIPRAAYSAQSEDNRQNTILRIRKAGLRYVAVDAAAYAGEGIGYLEAQLKPHVTRVLDFDDGTGVRLYELAEIDD